MIQLIYVFAQKKSIPFDDTYMHSLQWNNLIYHIYAGIGSLNYGISRLPEVLVQGPVVQSIVSLTSSLMTNSLTVVAKVFSNTLICFAANHVRGCCCTKATYIFSAKISLSLRKHANSNILKILPSKNKNFQIKIGYFSYFSSEHSMWALVRTASTRRF